MKGKLFWIGGVVVLLLAVGVTMALAEGTEYHACVNNASGTIHMADGPDDCNPNEQHITWNQVGPAGPQGEQGPPGEPGISGDLKFIRGTVHADGSIISGEGFTASLAPPFYFIEFTSPFSDIPLVSVYNMFEGNPDLWVRAGFISPASFEVGCYDIHENPLETDCAFNFVALGTP